MAICMFVYESKTPCVLFISESVYCFSELPTSRICVSPDKDPRFRFQNGQSISHFNGLQNISALDLESPNQVKVRSFTFLSLYVYIHIYMFYLI